MSGTISISARRQRLVRILMLMGALLLFLSVSGPPASASTSSAAPYTDCVANIVTPPYRIGNEISGVGEVRCNNNPGGASVEVCMQRSSYRGYVNMLCQRAYAEGPPSQPVFAQIGAGGQLLTGTYNYRLVATSTAPHPFGPPEINQEFSNSYTHTR